ncbi:MAG: glycosyltransferase family 4 protein [Candidatus Competibacteraceae bacterium]
MITKLPKIAIVVPNLTDRGGIPAVASFIYQAIHNSSKYTAEYISIPMSSHDNASVRLVSPRTWLDGIKVVDDFWNGKPFRHVGALFTEFEFQRYHPRSKLTALLNNYDLIQVVAGSPAWALVAKYVNQPVVLQVATLTSIERRKRLLEETGLYGLWFRNMTRITEYMDIRALKYVDRVLVENQWMCDLLSHKADASKVIFAPPGVDTSLFKTKGTARSDESYILSVGRFNDPRKNIELLFKAYYQLKQILPNAPRLFLAGQSPPPPSAWDIARSFGITPFIQYYAKCNQNELISLYQNASLFVLSSDEEGLGVVILEAMACGLPIVSTRCGGPETSITEGVNGFLTPLNDKHTLAVRMKDLLTNPVLCRAFGRKSRQLAEENFSLDKAGQKFLDVYDDLLKDKIGGK